MKKVFGNIPAVPFAIFMIIAVAGIILSVQMPITPITYQPMAACTDTDNGNDIFVYGICTDSNGVGYVDICYGGAIRERNCVNGACALNQTSCPSGYGCDSGACIPMPAANAIVSLNSPANNSQDLVPGNITFNWAPSNFSKPSVSCDIYIDGQLSYGKTCSVNQSCVYSGAGANLLPGSHSWSVTCDENSSETWNFGIAGYACGTGEYSSSQCLDSCSMRWAQPLGVTCPAGKRCCTPPLPVVALDLPTNNIAVSALVNLSWTPLDFTAPSVRCDVIIDKSPPSFAKICTVGQTCEVGPASLMPGSHSWNVTCNTTTSTTWTFNVGQEYNCGQGPFAGGQCLSSCPINWAQFLGATCPAGRCCAPNDHTECRNQRCIVVQSTGANQCTTDANCHRGGGGDHGCTENWTVIQDWQPVICNASRIQTKVWKDQKNCNTTKTLNVTCTLQNNTCIETKACVLSCTENWKCTDWSDCAQEGKRYRSCIDQNNCGTTASKPAESETCTYIPPAKMCSEMGGSICAAADENCDGAMVEAADTAYCCIGGNCVSAKKGAQISAATWIAIGLGALIIIVVIFLIAKRPKKPALPEIKEQKKPALNEPEETRT